MGEASAFAQLIGVALELHSNLYLRTQLVKNGYTYCEKYLNQDMDVHRLICEVV